MRSQNSTIQSQQNSWRVRHECWGLKIAPTAVICTKNGGFYPMVFLFISGDLQVPSFPGTPISSQPFLGLDHLTKTAPKRGERPMPSFWLWAWYRQRLYRRVPGYPGSHWRFESCRARGWMMIAIRWKKGNFGVKRWKKKRLNELQTGKNLTSIYQWK